MIKDEDTRLRAVQVRRAALCGEYATKVVEATGLEHLRLRIELRLSLWRLHRTSRLANLGADAYRVGPVKRSEVRGAEA